MTSDRLILAPPSTVMGTVTDPTRPSHAAADLSASASPRLSGADETVSRLTSGMAAGDVATVERFYRDYFDRLYGWARKFTRRDESFCLDVVQDATLRIVRNIRAVHAEQAFVAWMRLVVQTTAYDLLKASARRTTREQTVADTELTDASPADEQSQREQLDWLRAEMDALDPALARMIDLRFSAGWTLARIGRRFGISAGSVDGRLRRALATLRQSARERFHDE